MGPVDVTNPVFEQIVENWTKEVGELFVHVYLPSSGVEGVYYMVYSMSDVCNIVQDAAKNAVIYLTREKMLPLRGRANEQIKDALKMFLYKDWWLIAKPKVYPEEIEFFETGNTHEELAEALTVLRDNEVWIGPDFTFPDNYTKPNLDPNLIIARKYI